MEIGEERNIHSNRSYRCKRTQSAKARSIQFTRAATIACNSLACASRYRSHDQIHTAQNTLFHLSLDSRARAHMRSAAFIFASRIDMNCMREMSAICVRNARAMLSAVCADYCDASIG